MLELARPSDRLAVNAMAGQLHGQRTAWRPDLCRMEDLFSEERFLESIRQRRLFVARLHGCIAGYVLFSIRKETQPGRIPHKVLRIDQFFVEEMVRNQGIGGEMMAGLGALAAAFGCSHLELGVFPQNDAAVSFFQKCGFSISGIEMLRPV